MIFERIEKISNGCRRMKIRVRGCKGRNIGSQCSTQFESQISHSRDRYIQSSSNMRKAFNQHLVVISVKTNIASSIHHSTKPDKPSDLDTEWQKHPLHNQHMHQSQCGAVERVDAVSSSNLQLEQRVIKGNFVLATKSEWNTEMRKWVVR